MTTATETFEKRDCSRCGGSGRYSWNAMHGDRCYGCNGRGRVYTKRGRAAADFYTALLSKAISEVQVGDLVRDYDGRFRKVAVSARDTGNMESGSRRIGYDYEANVCWYLKFEGGSGMSGYPADHIVRIGHTADEKREAREKALAFQSTLNLNGTPRRTR